MKNLYGKYTTWGQLICGTMFCDIFVTGSHLVQDRRTGKFIPVKDLLEAERTEDYTLQMSCLITDDHLIPVGEYTFWDWEDGN